MVQDYLTQGAEKYVENAYKNLDTTKKNTDYTVWDRAESPQQPTTGAFLKDY